MTAAVPVVAVAGGKPPAQDRCRPRRGGERAYEIYTGAGSWLRADYDLPRDSLKPDVQVEYDRQLEACRAMSRPVPPDAVFPALGVQVREQAVQDYEAPAGAIPLGPLAGAEARSPGRAMFLPVGLAGLATKTKAAAFVIFADGTFRETALNGNAAVRAAQAEAVKFNLMAGTAAPAAVQQGDAAAALRMLVRLRDEGLLTDQEFAAKRAEVIARI